LEKDFTSLYDDHAEKYKSRIAEILEILGEEARHLLNFLNICLGNYPDNDIEE
jgi:hypothetical protein